MLARILALATTLALLVSAPALAIAQSQPPTPPHVFTGLAMVDGLPPADGTGLTARNGDMILAKALLVQGRYVLMVPYPSDGQTISFTIADFPADQTVTWAAGGASQLDLTTQMSRLPLPTVLDTLEISLVRVFHRDPETGAWTYFDPLINPGERNRFRLTPGQEYWVKLDRDQLVFHHNRETQLLAGWNVVVW